MSFHGDFVERYQRLFHLLKSCSAIRSLKRTKSLHALTITLGPNPNQTIFSYNNIISFYASLGLISLACKLFDKIPERNVVSFNTMISAYSRCNDIEGAWELFSLMRCCGFMPTQFTFASLLSCLSLDVCDGRKLQALAVKNGLFHADAFVGTALLGLYGRFGCIDEAFWTFEDLPRKSCVTWNSIISLFGNHGFVKDSMFLFRQLVRVGSASLSECSCLGVLSGLGSEQDLELGVQIHGLVIKNGIVCAVSVANSLINMYAKCSHIHLAEKLFEEMCFRDIVSWNTIIGALARSGYPVKALDHFSDMSMAGVVPNQATYVNVISSCIVWQTLLFGKLVHAKTIKDAFDSDVFVGSSLVDFYSKSGHLEDAHRCFNSIHQKNVVSWNTLIVGYANSSPATSASLLLEMLQLGYRPNEFTFSAILRSLSAIEMRQLHSLIIRMGYEHNEYVFSSLMTSYAKNGLISDTFVLVSACERPLPVVPSNIVAGIFNSSCEYSETLKLLSVLEEPDVVSWNIVIAACARVGDYKEAFEMFRHMCLTQICPDNYTFVSLLSVCSKLCNLTLGSSVHGLIIKNDFNLCDTFVCNILIDMYGKCGSVESSLKIANIMRDRNLITWTALISALGINGHAHEALERFREMEFLGLKPDRVAFIAMFTVCRHSGLVKEGMELFRRMSSYYGVEPEMDHYHCIVDLLARYGHIKEAEKVISSMPYAPDALVWRTFLEGCKRHRTVEDGAIGQIDVDLIR